MSKIQKIEGLLPDRPRSIRNLPDHLKLSAIIAALALSIGPVSLSHAAAEQAVLEPVTDQEIARLLERHFTLPMALNSGALSIEERGTMIAAEVTKLTNLLTGQGYLGAWVDATGSGTVEDPLRLRPVPGPRYRMGDIRIDGLPPQPDAAFAETIENLVEQQKSVPAGRSVVESLGPAILYELRQRSFANASLAEVAYDLDPQAAVADLVLRFDPGSPKQFRKVNFFGSLRMSDAEAQALVPFEPGAAYSLTAIESLRSALDQTGVFRRISIDTEAVPEEPGLVDVSVRVSDRGVPLEAQAQPRILFATIFALAVIQIVRMTRLWSHRKLHLLLMVSAFVLLSGSAIELTRLLYQFLFN